MTFVRLRFPPKRAPGYATRKLRRFVVIGFSFRGLSWRVVRARGRFGVPSGGSSRQDLGKSSGGDSVKRVSDGRGIPGALGAAENEFVLARFARDFRGIGRKSPTESAELPRRQELIEIGPEVALETTVRGPSPESARVHPKLAPLKGDGRDARDEARRDRIRGVFVGPTEERPDGSIGLKRFVAGEEPVTYASDTNA